MDSRLIIEEITAQLDAVMATDAAWIRKRLAVARRRLASAQPADRMLRQLLLRFEESRKAVERRRAGLPGTSYDPQLPISAHREEIIAAIRAHPVVIVAGETGSGKTTQLPKLCLDAARGLRGLVGCTQPRRIAARAMAERVAEELQTELGGPVGYQVRFRERFSPDGYIKFMTDGILLAESLRDPRLDAYDTLIIDEAHERSLNIDFLLGYLQRLQDQRSDLRLIVTSATIDTEKFSRHFDAAPVIEVSGRSYPVDVIYQPLEEESGQQETADRDLYEGIAAAVRSLDKIDPRGDVLVFLSGEREIREAGDYLKKQRGRRGPGSAEVLPLYARLSSAEQRRVFHPGPQRRIILSTNVAETSLTVPRIRFVVDSGLARISRYAHRSQIQRLPIEPISQASANQRAGRCGRLGPGTCVRLFSREDFEARPEFTEPEILRTSLAAVILRMLTMGLGAVEDFPFIDPPAPRMINDAQHLLFELSAVDESRSLTALGRRLARWPLDVRLARMVEEGARLGCVEDLLVLAAALSIQDPRERPLDAQAAADEAHARFSNEKSDFVALLQLWQYLRELRKSVSGNRFRKKCASEFLNWQRVLEWFDLYQQLRDQAREDGLALSGGHGEYETVHRALLAGLLSHCGNRNPEDRSYRGARAKTFYIFPGSGLFGAAPKWLMAAEIVETSRPYARNNAVIQPEWIEAQGQHLLKRHVFDPHWSRRAGAVMAWEQVTLYGLVIVERRRLQFAPVDPVEARRIFILEALVRGELDTRAGFREHNEKIRAEVEALEHKRRRRDVLADENAVYDFFDARIPLDVNSARSFEKWLASLGEEGRERLYLGHDVLTREDAGTAPGEWFPDRIELGDRHFSLEYHFEPGHERDGVSLSVPLELLNTLDEGRLQWLVPGLRREKLETLIAQLPKPVRRSLTPVAHFADALLERLGEREQQAMLKLCADELGRMTGLDVSERQFDESRLPAHLRFYIEVTDEDGNVLAGGRDLAAIRERLGARAQRRFMDRRGEGFNRDGETAWTFGRLPERVETADGVTAWPALVAQGDAVGLRLFDTQDEALISQAAGLLRLLGLQLSDKLQYLRKRHGLKPEALLAWSLVGTAQELLEDFAHKALLDTAADERVEAPFTGMAARDEDSFKALVERVRNGILKTGLELARLLNESLAAYQRIHRALNGRVESRWPETFTDISTQIQDMVYPGFLADLETGRLQHYPRYLAAIEERLAALELNPQRDRERQALIEPWWQRYLERLEAGHLYDEDTDRFRWLLEEYRVSLFAQRLGTAEKVSEKRIAQAWETLPKTLARHGKS